MAGYLSELEEPAAERFFAELANGRFMTTRCPACANTFFPPRTVCPECLGDELEWVELPGTGTVYAFSQQHHALTSRGLTWWWQWSWTVARAGCSHFSRRRSRRSR